jgi:hypothetical protein
VPQAKDTSFTSQFFAMYQDSSLSSLDRRHFGAFLSDKRRFDRFQRNLLLQQVIEQERERVRRMRDQMEARKVREIEARMEGAATRIQRAYRRKKDGKSMIMHIKDVMKKLIEAEKAKARLGEMLTDMQDETLRYWHSYLSKNVDKIVKL